MIKLESCLDEVLAITCATRTKDSKTGIGRRQTGIESLQPLLYRMNRIAAIGHIVIVDNAAFGVEQYDLGGSGTGVDAEKGIEDGNVLSRLGFCFTQVLLQGLSLCYQPVEVSSRQLALGYPLLPCLIVGSILEDRSHSASRRDALHIVCCANLID